MKIYIVRHGETDWNKLGRLQGRDDIPLNETGREEAREAGRELCEAGCGAVITSPLSRAKETAEIIAGITGIPEVETDAGFIERDFGELSGLEVKACFAQSEERRRECIESEAALKERLFAALKRQIDAHMGTDIIIVSHGAAINCLRAALSGGKLQAGHELLKNGSVTRLEYKGGDVILSPQSANLQP